MFNLISQSLLGFIFWLNNFFNDFGLTIIIFSLILKTIISPLEYLAFLEENKMRRIRPKILEILKKYKNDLQKQVENLNSLYQEEKYNPFLTLFVQFLPLPLFIGVFFTLNQLLKIKNGDLFFLGFIDLTKTNIFLALLVIIFQLLFIFNLESEQKKFAFIFFGLMIVVLIQFPAIFNLYWLVNLVLTFIQRPIFRILEAKNY